MAAPKGHPKWGGRQKGTPDKKTAEFRQQVVASGLTPLEVMLSNMRHWLEKGERDKAQRCAADAAPYLHAKLSSIDAKVAVSQDPREMTEAELLAIIAAEEQEKLKESGIPPDGTVH